MSAPRSFILTYHSIDTTGSVISTAPSVFREQMRLLAQSGLRIVPLAELSSSPGAVSITFDDAFRSLYEQAFPMLQQYGFPATVFVVSGHCGGRNDWASQTAGVPLLDLMGWAELREMADAGHTIGCHTVTHPRLDRMPAAAVERELQDNRQAVEDKVGQPAETFAYPYGAYNEMVLDCARQHFKVACGTRLNFLAQDDDPHLLPRLDTYYLQDPKWFGRVHTKTGEVYISTRALLRELREASGL